MNSEGRTQFENLKTDLIAHEAIAREEVPDRQFLGVGRTVLLGNEPIGVYARSANPLVVDFIKNGQVIAYVNYRATADGRVTIGFNEHPERFLSIVDVAKNLGGSALKRHTYNPTEQVVSEDELQFVVDFIRDTTNATAMIKFTSKPDQPVTGLDVLHLLSNLATPL
ncbi:MAG: hypothetical protein ABI602_02090 [Candidatus Saccharibacteria bacterium]